MANETTHGLGPMPETDAEERPRFGHNAELSGPRALILSPEPWGQSWVSKHHYAATLAGMGARVLFAGPSDASVPAPPPGVSLLRLPSIPKGIRHYPRPLRRTLHRRLGKALELAAGGPLDLIWSFDPSRLLDLDCTARGAQTIFFMADFDASLPWRIPAATADLCLGCCHGIVERLREASATARFVHHGFADLAAEPFHFDTAPPNVTYAGSLAHSFIDTPRVGALLAAYPFVRFHFFGDDGTGNLGTGVRSELAKALEQRDNVTVHGAVPASRLPGIYQSSDALLVLHRPGFDRVGNPHKMIEYLGSGTPILSTRLREYAELGDVLAMHDNIQEFCDALGPLLETSDPDGAARRREFALQNSYENNIQRIWRWLAEATGGTRAALPVCQGDRI